MVGHIISKLFLHAYRKVMKERNQCWNGRGVYNFDQGRNEGDSNPN